MRLNQAKKKLSGKNRVLGSFRPRRGVLYRVEWVKQSYALYYMKEPWLRVIDGGKNNRWEKIKVISTYVYPGTWMVGRFTGERVSEKYVPVTHWTIDPKFGPGDSYYVGFELLAIDMSVVSRKHRHPYAWPEEHMGVLAEDLRKRNTLEMKRLDVSDLPLYMNADLVYPAFDRILREQA